MTNAKKILVTTESHELFIVRRRSAISEPHTCHMCPTGESMLTLEEAIDLTGISTLQLIQHLDSPAIHHYETAAGRLLICQGSLKNLVMEL